MGKNRKSICALLVFSLVAGFPLWVSAEMTGAFPDVPVDAEYAEAVAELARMGIITGDQKGNFNPNSTITRGEAATIICRMLGVEEEAKQISTCSFTDTRSHWSAGYVEKASELGIINGYNSTTFGPNDPVTYVQMIKLLVCAWGYQDISVEFGGYPNGYIKAAEELGITEGMSFNDSEPAPRYAVAELVYHTMFAG